jgi:hypothetical protein
MSNLEDTSNPSAKVTLVDLLSCVCFFAPIAGGFLEGAKIGLAGTAIGVALGVVLGVLSGLGLRMSARSLANHWWPAEDPISIPWFVIETVFFLTAEMAWVLGMSFMAISFIRFVVQLAAA